MSMRSILSGLVCGGLMLATTATASAHPYSTLSERALASAPLVERSFATTPWLATTQAALTDDTMVYAASMQTDEEMEELMDAIDELIDALEDLQDELAD